MITAKKAHAQTRYKRNKKLKPIIKEIESQIETLIYNSIEIELYQCTFHFDLDIPTEVQVYIIKELKSLGYKVDVSIPHVVTIEWT